MTDLFDAEDVEINDFDNPDVRFCAFTGCENTFEVDRRNPIRASRKFCDEHRTTKAPAKKKAKDRAPRSTVNLNLGPQRSTKKDGELEAVEARVKQLLNMVSGALAIAGQTDDALDIARGRDQVAASLKELARYEPWLRKLAAGGETGDRAMCWVAAIMAIATMLIPIADRRGWIPDQLRPMLVATVAVPDVAPSAGAEPVAA